MPTIRMHDAFIRLHEHDGFPWSLPVWQDITGVTDGLFPSDDAHLPAGMSRQDSDDIKSYFSRFLALGSVGEQIELSQRSSRKEVLPGREKWKAWFARAERRWRLHTRVLKVLEEEGADPRSICVVDGKFVGWPALEQYSGMLVDPVAVDLFGREAFKYGTLLPYPLRPCVVPIIARSWDNLRRVFDRDRKNMSKLESDAKSAYESFCSGPTKAKFTKAMRTVSRWLPYTKIFCTDENQKLAEDMMDKINDVFLTLGRPVGKATSRPKGLTKFTREQVAGLASPSDVEDLVRLYHDLFQLPLDSEPVLPDQETTLTLRDASVVDLGVEAEAMMSPEQLASRLGFKGSRPFQFNEYRHRSGAVAWDPAAKHLFNANPPDDGLQEISLHWHQLAGVHSMVRNVFLAGPDPKACTGVLCADEVGLGKTALAISFLAFLSNAIWHEKEGGTRFPILEELPYLRSKKAIPSLPHLICVPGTLLSQWEHELKVFFKPHVVDILTYGSSKVHHAEFWDKAKGAMGKSLHEDHQKIILVSHSALLQDYQLVYESKNSRRHKKPWDLPSRKAGSEVLAGTLFGYKYLTVVLDEAHQLRNLGSKHYAALRLMEQATIRLVMTATPLQTAPKDIASIARLSGIPYFFSEESLEEEKETLATIRRVKRRQREELASGEPLDDPDAVRAAQITAVLRLQQQFRGRIIRRTIDSKDWRGFQILNLPPYKTIRAIVKLTEREMKIILELAQSAKESVSSAASGEFLTKKFYLEYRMAFGFAKTNPDDESIPVFISLEQWEPLKSTKIDVCARICKHLLTRDDAPEVSFEDGLPAFPPMPPLLDGEDILQERRILIFQEFIAHGSLLTTILKLYGVESVAINGTISFEKRNEIVERFHKPKSPRVLIFSSVGCSGLNLAIADVVILLDQPWSAQDERQIRGRAHRQPQKKVVHMYHLLADGTSDLLLSDMAQGKQDMLEAFLNKQAGKEMLEALKGHISCDSDDEYIPPTVTKKQKEKKKRPTREKKGKPRETREKSQIPEQTAEEASDSQEPLTNSEADVVMALAVDGSFPGEGSESDGSIPPLTDSDGGGYTSGMYASVESGADTSKSVASDGQNGGSTGTSSEDEFGGLFSPRPSAAKRPHKNRHYSKKPGMSITSNSGSEAYSQRDSDTGPQQKKTKTGGLNLSSSGPSSTGIQSVENGANAAQEMDGVINENQSASRSEEMVDLGGDSSPPRRPISSRRQLEEVRRAALASDRRLVLKIRDHPKEKGSIPQNKEPAQSGQGVAGRLDTKIPQTPGSAIGTLSQSSRKSRDLNPFFNHSGSSKQGIENSGALSQPPSTRLPALLPGVVPPLNVTASRNTALRPYTPVGDGTQSPPSMRNPTRAHLAKRK